MTEQEEVEAYMKEQEEAESAFMEYLLDHPEEYFCDDVARAFLDDYFEEDEECRATFDEYHCKSCDCDNDCFYNECAAEAEWEMQQQFIKDGNKRTDTGATYYEKIISDDDIPF
ncbi:MAG: hypothetical protein K2J44_02090 [Ruminococcus sp.]|nr:hypothetical protein [Ruminococcus sp.]